MILSPETARSAGFTINWAGSDVNAERFGPRAAHPLISRASDGEREALFYGRLLYQGELAERIGNGRAAVGEAAALALASYRVDKSRWAEWLEGEFACAIVDHVDRRIMVLRSPSNAPPVFWRKTRSGGALATGLTPLCHRDEILDSEYLIRFLALGWQETDLIPATPFRGINRLQTGQALVIHTARRVERITQIHEWSDVLAQEQTDASPEELRNVLSRAVMERCTSPVAAHLSGGMDSTTICALASEAFESVGKALDVISVRYNATESLRSESDFDSVVHFPSLVRRHRLDGDALLDFGMISAAAVFEEPYSGFFRLPKLTAMLAQARDLNARTLLTGLGADESLCDVPVDIAGAIGRGRICAAWRQTRGWLEITGAGRLETLYRYGFAPYLAAMPIRTAASLVSRDTKPPPWLRGGAALRELWCDSAHARGRDEAWAARSVPSWIARAHTITASDAFAHALGAPNGVWISHPFRDPRAVRALSRARMRFPAQPARQKPALAAAVPAVLPRGMALRKRKVAFDEIHIRGLAANCEALRALITTQAPKIEAIIDAPQLMDAVSQARLGAMGGRAMDDLNNALALLVWLQGR